MSHREQEHLETRPEASSTIKPASKINSEPRSIHEVKSEGVPPIVNEVLQSPGQPLNPEARALFEPRFGHDFSQVRVHTDAKAQESARTLAAAAYTIGNDIVLGQPYGQNGRKDTTLLAHELTHVVQNVNSERNLLSSIGAPSHLSEREAEGNAVRVMQGDAVHLSSVLSSDSAILLAPETWYRGEAIGVGPAAAGSVPHDLGDGLYLTDTEDVARLYASTRAGDATTEGRVLTASLERRSLGKVLDLTTDVRWQKLMQTKAPGGKTYEEMIKMANENYGRFIKSFLTENNINIDDYDAIIGPEYVRGGKQVCIRKPSLASRITALFSVKQAGIVKSVGRSTTSGEEVRSAPPVKRASPEGMKASVKPKAGPRFKTPAIKMSPRLRSGVRVVGSVGVGILVSLFAGWIQSKIEEWLIGNDLEKINPEIEREIAKLGPSIAAFLDEAPGARLYANITIELKYCTTIDPDNGPDTIYQGLKLKSVNFSTESVTKQATDRVEMYLLDKWQFVDATFSLPLTTETVADEDWQGGGGKYGGRGASGEW